MPRKESFENSSRRNQLRRQLLMDSRVLAVADIAGTPEQVFHAITSNEVEQWWKMPGVYRRKEWKADVIS